MSEEVIKDKSDIVESNSKPNKKDSPSLVIFREILGGLFWIFLFTKIFIYDIDLFVVGQINPSWLFIFDYKFFILIGLVCFIWVSIGTNNFSKLISVILFFPFIFIFWRIPKIFWKSKSWIGVFASFGILFSFFSSAKINFTTFVFVALSTLLIFTNNNDVLLIVSMAIMFAYLLYHFAKRLKYAFKPSHIFTVQSEAINIIWDGVKSKFKVAEEIRDTGLVNMTPSQRDGFCNNLQFVIIINRILYFITFKLKRFQKSNLNVIYYFASIFYTMIITVMVFALQNIALFKIDPSSFNTTPKNNFLFFVYYSFNTLFTNSINDFYPISDYARFLSSFETFSAFILLAIIFFLFTTIVRDRHNEEITTAITSMKKKGEELELVISEDYKMDLKEAIQFIESIQGNLVKIIYYFSENIDKDST